MLERNIYNKAIGLLAKTLEFKGKKKLGRIKAEKENVGLMLLFWILIGGSEL